MAGHHFTINAYVHAHDLANAVCEVCGKKFSEHAEAEKVRSVEEETGVE